MDPIRTRERPLPPDSHRRRAAAAAVALVSMFAGARLFGELDERRVLDPNYPAVNYETAPLTDRASALGGAIRSGQAKLEYDSHYGYLPSVLKALDVPVSSQVLVFSKTSFQAPHIYPRKPRALYFNDEVAVGWVRGGDVVEITSQDPSLGTVFHVIDQEDTPRPNVERRGECLQCHLSWTTAGVPGLLIRSVQPDRNGVPLSPTGGYITDHRSPLEQRWGGWYVTGTHGSQRHMGNSIFGSGNLLPAATNVTDLKSAFDTGAYLSPHSDLVALMVLEHQTRMSNLITRAGYEARIAIREGKAMAPDAVEALVNYMLFGGETPLSEPIRGTSGFAAEFSRRGPFDSRGRSLRQLDLEKRIFRYPCSYLIYSKAFDALPGPALDLVYRRLWQVLSGRDSSGAFAQLSPRDRTAILEILRDTKPGLPGYWSAPASSR